MSRGMSLPIITASAVHHALLAKEEIALIDVREEHPFAQKHPLFAVRLSPARFELDAPWRLPRRDVLIAIYDNGEGQTEVAEFRLQAIGYSRVHLLDDGLGG